MLQHMSSAYDDHGNGYYPTQNHGSYRCILCVSDSFNYDIQKYETNAATVVPRHLRPTGMRHTGISPITSTWSHLPARIFDCPLCTSDPFKDNFHTNRVGSRVKRHLQSTTLHTGTKIAQTPCTEPPAHPFARASRCLLCTSDPFRDDVITNNRSTDLRKHLNSASSHSGNRVAPINSIEPPRHLTARASSCLLCPFDPFRNNVITNEKSTDVRTHLKRLSPHSGNEFKEGASQRPA